MAKLFVDMLCDGRVKHCTAKETQLRESQGGGKALHVIEERWRGVESQGEKLRKGIEMIGAQCTVALRQRKAIRRAAMEER